MKLAFVFAMLAAALLTAGCAVAQSGAVTERPSPIRLDELSVLSGQGLTDDALIAEIEQRGVAFVLSQADFEAQRAAGLSEGVLRYLQGRSAADKALRAQILSGRYRSAAYGGVLYLGYPYLGYHDGLHYYGYSYGYYHGYSGGHRSTPLHWGYGARRGGHHGGHH